MNQPTPAIVSQQAVRTLPRWALVLLCLAYVVPGFVGRAPWRNTDITAFGYMLALFEGRTEWMSPLLAGMAPQPDGLLPYWLGAWALQLAPAAMPAEMAVRLPFMLLLLVAMAATWWGVYCLARSPGAQPVAFAFGGEANPVDYARAMADGGLLALIACLGLAQLSHETTSYVTQLACTTLVFFAAAAMPYRRSAPAAAMLLGMAGLVLSGAPAMAVLMGLGCAALAWFSPPAEATCAARGWSLAWLASTALAALLATALDLWQWRIALPPLDSPEWASLLRLLAWFSWPAWPLALWTLWRWRRQIAHPMRHRHLVLPIWFAGLAFIAAVLTQPADRALLPGLPAIATLAAFALPTLRRSIGALIDWFTLIFFSVSAITIWVIWISMQTGVPAKPAANVAKLAPGFVPEFSLLAFVVALTASVAWCALVVWRTSRNRAAIWKTLVLPAGGATLGWLLLMTLWLPLLDYARSYAPQIQQVMAAIGEPAPRCVATYGLSRAQLTGLEFHGRVATTQISTISEDRRPCDWLVADAQMWDATQDRALQRGWQPVARIARPTVRNDQLILLRKRPGR